MQQDLPAFTESETIALRCELKHFFHKVLIYLLVVALEKRRHLFKGTLLLKAPAQGEEV